MTKSFLKLKSFVQDHEQVVPAEVEISLIGGLPQIIFLGLPDQAIKESAHRIKNAIRVQGYEFPKAKSIIVNIRPNHFKKTSRGLELAVAFGVLYLTQQILWKETIDHFYFYGELSLSGDIVFPDDFLKLPPLNNKDQIITGWGEASVARETYQFKNLKSFQEKELNKNFRILSSIVPTPLRPNCFQDFVFSHSQVFWIKLIATGWHPTMIAGSAGTGKSLVLKAIGEFLEEPLSEELLEISRRNIRFDVLKWRPLISVHHTATHLSLVGGGNVPHPGELYRAHKGVLLLDEFLEFSKKIQETLRGPMEEGIVRISRSTHSQEYPFDTLVLGTTNLCPCGDWVPNASVSCGRSLFKCRSYRERLSGPVLDRFQLLFYSLPSVFLSEEGAKKEQEMTGGEILEYLQKVYDFQKKRRKELGQDLLRHNSQMSLKELQKGLDMKHYELHFSSQLYNPRRQRSILSVARSFADMDFSVNIESKHLTQSIKHAGLSFERLKTLG